MENKSILEKVLLFLGIIMMAVLTMVAFYKIPTIIADKIAYRDVMRKNIKQDFTEEDE